MGGTREGALKQKKAYLAKDPDHYKKLAAKAREARGNKPSPGSFKKGSPAAKAAAAKSAAVRTAKARAKRDAVQNGESNTPGKSRGEKA